MDTNILKNIQNVVENTISTCPHNGPDQPKGVSKIRNKSNLPQSLYVKKVNLVLKMIRLPLLLLRE
jgi:hypothetical protein